jgi:hypothetical protein
MSLSAAYPDELLINAEASAETGLGAVHAAVSDAAATTDEAAADASEVNRTAVSLPAGAPGEPADDADAFAFEADPEPSEAAFEVDAASCPPTGATFVGPSDVVVPSVMLAAYAVTAKEGPPRRMTLGMKSVGSTAGVATEAVTAAAG